MSVHLRVCIYESTAYKSDEKMARPAPHVCSWRSLRLCFHKHPRLHLPVSAHGWEAFLHGAWPRCCSHVPQLPALAPDPGRPSAAASVQPLRETPAYSGPAQQQTTCKASISIHYLQPYHCLGPAEARDCLRIALLYSTSIYNHYQLVVRLPTCY